MKTSSESAPPSDPPPNRLPEPVHGPETKLFDRVRNWVDVFPWLRLVRVCRVAGGPIWITHALVMTLVWTLGCGVLQREPNLSLETLARLPVWSLAWMSTLSPSDAVVDRSPGDFSANVNWKVVLWTILLWLPTAMALLRVGSMLTAGRDMPSYLGTFRDVLRRIRGALLIVVLPSLVASLFWLIGWGVTQFAAWLAGSLSPTWVMWATLPIVLPSTILAVVLVLGGRAAVPLAIAAVMIESDPDPLDSLSRGYEYTLRRLPQLLLLSLVSLVISGVIVLAFEGVAWMGSQVVVDNVALQQCLAVLPGVIGMMLLWSMVGGIYLLLRQSAGGQEVEEIAVESDHWKSPKLPSVQQA